MTYPYLITSDLHCHSWSQFSRISRSGVNSRLDIILTELSRAYETLHLRGGDTAFMAGDLFHVRGRIEPSVFNPTFDMIKHIHDKIDVTTYAIPGNHDLEGKESTALGNAMQALGAIRGFNVDTKVTRHNPNVLVVPWYQDLDELRAVLREEADKLSPTMREKVDVIIHAPVNGILKGLPDHGLEAEELAALGFRRVFAGHFHNHKVMCDGKVISVGATTHQTWNDPGTKAGFLLVYEDHIEHFPSDAPDFVDFDIEKGDLESIAGNYVRAKLYDVTDKEINQWRRDFETAGALGISIIATKKSTTGIRSGATAKSMHSLDASVNHYIVNDLKPMFPDEVSKLSQAILDEART